jgi:hypothetical protein
VDDIASANNPAGQSAPAGADDDGPSTASVVSNTVSSGGNSIRAGLVNFSLAPKVKQSGSSSSPG